MPTTTFNIRMDENLKKNVDDVAKSLGMTPAAAFNVFARQFVAHRGFPFAVVAPTPTELEFAEDMDRIYLSMSNGQVSEHQLVEV